MVPECVINMSSVFMRHFSFDCSPVPPHCFGEKLENVTVLQLTCSDLKGPFDCLLPYEDLPLMCWTYAHQLSPEISKYSVLVAHTGKSVKVAVFHLHVSSPFNPPEYSFQKTHQMLPIFPCFTQWCTFLIVSDGIFGHMVMKKVLPRPTKYFTDTFTS